MPLSSPAAREHIHTRKVQCEGFRRADGLWDIEGHITDTKTYGFGNRERGQVPPGAPIHDMSIRLTVDDGLTIHARRGDDRRQPLSHLPQRHAEFSAPGRPPDRARFSQIGARTSRRHRGLHPSGRAVGPGRHHRVPDRDAAGAARSLQAERGRTEPRPAAAAQRPLPPLLNSCYAFSDEREVVARQWPDFARKPEPTSDDARARSARPRPPRAAPTS